MSFFAKLKSGLGKTSGKLTDGIGGIFTKAKLDDEALLKLEDVLIEADMGAKLAAEIVGKLREKRFDKDISPQEVKAFLAEEITGILKPFAVPLVPDADKKPAVIIMVGVNGNGKTTTMGKMAASFKRQGLTVVLAAADTFRAAAVEQLQSWGARSNIEVITGAPQADPASVAFRAYEEARAKNADVLMIDTAGRLQNKANLMAELSKIVKAIGKVDATAPHHVIQVLDATTGQNALSQVQAFKDLANVTGLVITKLDGTAKGGVVVALAKQFNLPIHAVGVGEGIDDLQAFEAADFARNLVSLDIGH